jgi:hypothetical protein
LEQATLPAAVKVAAIQTNHNQCSNKTSSDILVVYAPHSLLLLEIEATSPAAVKAAGM